MKLFFFDFSTVLIGIGYFCNVKQERIIVGLEQLGTLMVSFGENKEWKDFSVGVTQQEYESFQGLINKQKSLNGWFTKENVRASLLALGKLLSKEQLTEWSSKYSYTDKSKRVGIIMAGNIPLVGFHDFICVLVSGNTAICKLSSNDKTLLPKLGEFLIEFVPFLKDRITEGRIGEIDAVIATGSDNSMKYFEQYFGKYPHIFRKNRTSVAVLSGKETKKDFQHLGNDIFSYFGLGCRNVSHLLIPRDFVLDRFFEGILPFSHVIDNNKYGNNYDYNKAVYLMNLHKIMDNNFVLLRESEELFSPLSMIHYHYYDNQNEVDEYLLKHEKNIQVVVGYDHLPFGKSQSPGLLDYADGIDVMGWLAKV